MTPNKDGDAPVQRISTEKQSFSRHDVAVDPQLAAKPDFGQEACLYILAGFLLYLNTSYVVIDPFLKSVQLHTSTLLFREREAHCIYVGGHSIPSVSTKPTTNSTPSQLTLPPQSPGSAASRLSSACPLAYSRARSTTAVSSAL